MFTVSSTRLAAAVGCLALSLTAAAGVAAANPGADPVIDTTCSYPQVVSALNAQNPAAAAQFNATPVAQSWLSSFLASSPDQRRQMVQQVQSAPEAQPYLGAFQAVANTCNNY